MGAKMTHIMFIVSLASGRPCAQAGRYLLSWKPGGPRRQGILQTTADPLKAKRFAGQGAAFAFYMQVDGLRPDGQPNRPLTAFTMQVMEPDAEPITDVLDGQGRLM